MLQDEVGIPPFLFLYRIGSPDFTPCSVRCAGFFFLHVTTHGTPNPRRQISEPAGWLPPPV